MDDRQDDDAQSNAFTGGFIRLVTLIGTLTAGVTAVLYATGLWSIGGRDSALGLPGSAVDAAALTRAGYGFIVDSAEALTVLARDGMRLVPAADWTAIGTVGIVSGTVWLLLRVRGVRQRLPGWWPHVFTGHGAAISTAILVASAYNILSLVSLFGIRELLFADPTITSGRTKRIVEALGEPAGPELPTAYGVHVLLALMTALATLWLWKRTHREMADAERGKPLFGSADGQLIHRVAPRATAAALWVIGAFIVLQVILLPRAHGVYIRTGIRPQCVALTLRPQLAKEIDATIDRNLMGFLLTDLSAGPSEIQQLSLERPPRVRVFQRADVIGLEFRPGECGESLLRPKTSE